jgi:hypothetical protein
MSKVAKIRLHNGMEMQIDSEDLHLIEGKVVNAVKPNPKFNSWYAIIRRDDLWNIKSRRRVNIYVHRIIMRVSDPSVFVDHKDHDTLNNQKSNLRLSTFSQNRQNMKVKANKTGSKYKGVHKGTGANKHKFVSSIHANGRSYHLGTFSTDKEAAKAYNDAAMRLQGEYAYLNNI